MTPGATGHGHPSPRCRACAGLTRSSLWPKSVASTGAATVVRSQRQHCPWIGPMVDRCPNGAFLPSPTSYCLSLKMAHWRPFTLHSTHIAMSLSLGCHRQAAALRSGDLRNRRRDAAHRVLCNQQGAPYMGPMPASQPAVTRLAAAPVPSHPSRDRSCTCTFSAGTKGGFRVLERTGALVPQVAHWPACWLCCFSLRSARLICLCGSVPPSLLRTHAVPRNRHTCRVCWSRQPNMAGGLRGRLS